MDLSSYLLAETREGKRWGRKGCFPENVMADRDGVAKAGRADIKEQHVRVWLGGDQTGPGSPEM